MRILYYNELGAYSDFLGGWISIKAGNCCREGGVDGTIRKYEGPGFGTTNLFHGLETTPYHLYTPMSERKLKVSATHIA